VERRPESLLAAAAVLREHSLEPAIKYSDKDFAVDIIGTSGNGFSLFNVSTAAGITADADVMKVCRHAVTSIPCADIRIRSKASSSSSGSADFLESLNLFLLHRYLEQLSRSGLFPSPSFLYLIATANWHRLHHTEKN